MRRDLVGATAEVHRGFWRKHKGPVIDRAVVSRKMLAAFETQAYYNPFAKSPADHRWAIAFGFWRYNQRVKPLPAPNIPGKTEFERFDNAMRQVLSVSKEELLKREAQYKKERGRKRRAKKSSST